MNDTNIEMRKGQKRFADGRIGPDECIICSSRGSASKISPTPRPRTYGSVDASPADSWFRI